MTLVIILFGVLVMLAGVVIVASPSKVFSLFGRFSGSLVFYLLAIGVRLALGVALVSLAGFSRYPEAISVLGWIAFLAGIFLIIIGRKRFNQLISWFLSKSRPLGRVAGLLAILFGAFLAYAFA